MSPIVCKFKGVNEHGSAVLGENNALQANLEEDGVRSALVTIPGGRQYIKLYGGAQINSVVVSTIMSMPEMTAVLPTQEGKRSSRVCDSGKTITIMYHCFTRGVCTICLK